MSRTSFLHGLAFGRATTTRNATPLAKYLKTHGIDASTAPFHRAVDAIFLEAQTFEAATGTSPSIPSIKVNLCMPGVQMEDTAALLKATNGEVQESRRILQELVNELASLREVIEPALMAQAQSLRSARMTVVTEVNTALAAMREVRRFFLETDYATEVERLERFVRLCRELEALKARGVLDAVCDVAIRLAVQEPMETPP